MRSFNPPESYVLASQHMLFTLCGQRAVYAGYHFEVYGIASAPCRKRDSLGFGRADILSLS